AKSRSGRTWLTRHSLAADVSPPPRGASPPMTGACGSPDPDGWPVATGTCRVGSAPVVHTRQLLDAIRARPEDDRLRLGHADAAEEAGDVEQAEFIRIGIAIAEDRATTAQRARAAELESRHGERFVGPVLAEHAEGWSFRRGLVDTIRNVPPCTLAD